MIGASIPVELIVGGEDPATQRLSISPSSLEFSATPGDDALARSVILDGHPNTLFRIGAVTQPWLSITPTIGVLPATIAVRVVPAGLAPGVHNARIEVWAGSATEPRTIPVTLTITESPQLQLSASNLVFAGRAGADAPPQQTVLVSSVSRNIGIQAVSSASWLRATLSGSKTPALLTVSAETRNLAKGSYTANIRVTSSEPGVTEQVLTVTLNAGNAPALTVSPSVLSIQHTIGDETPEARDLLVISETPMRFEAAIEEGAPWLKLRTPSGDAPGVAQFAVDPANLPPGTYEGVLRLRAGLLSSSAAIRLVVRNPRPVALAGGVVNSANYLQGPVAPGSLVSIFGEFLSASTARAESAPWPVKLADVSVTVNGIAAPLAMVSPEQIDIQIPAQVRPGVARVVIVNAGRSSAAVIVPIAHAAPGAFYSAEDGTAVQHADYSANSPANRAAPGDIVVAWLTGQGPLSETIENGAPSPPDQIVAPTLPLQCTVGGATADVAFAGMAPGLVGVLQVNLILPAVEAGQHALTVVIGGMASNAVPVYVRSAKEQQ